jgi:prepilin-type N-terminal cleavage/methylation domain-containing protein
MRARMRLRRGLSLVELLIAVVLLGIVGAGITRLMQSQMRYFAKTTNAREARSVSRNALNLMRNEMKMIEPRGIIAASADSITVYVPYTVGLRCSGTTGTFMGIDSLTQATAVYAGVAVKDTLAGSTFTYTANTTAPSAGLVATCTGAGLDTIPGGRTLIVSPSIGTTTVGAYVYLLQRVTYKIANSTIAPGRKALWRVVSGGASEEIAVPFDASSHFEFYVSNATTAQTAVPGTLSTITGLELVLVGESQRTSPGSAAPEESTQRVAILFRNASQ